MAAHRYWRLTIVSPPGGAANGPISEVELRTSIGGADVTGSGTPSVDSVVSGSAANLFDNSTATSWNGNGGVGFNWIGYDFGGSPQDIAEVVVTSTAGYPAHPSTHALVLSYSDDGIVFTPRAPAFDLAALVGGGTVTVNGFADMAPRVVSVGPRFSAGVPVSAGYRTAGRVARYDAVDGGGLSLDGTCEVDSTPTDIPVRRQVRLLERNTARLVREMWSDPVTGAWTFPGLRDNLYTVIGHDHTLVNLAVIIDNVRPT